MNGTRDERSREFEAMDKYYVRIETAHKGKIADLEKSIASYTEPMEGMVTTIESNQALAGYLWKNRPVKMSALFPVLARGSVRMDAMMSDEVRVFLLDSILGIMVEDAEFWPKSLDRYLSGRRRSLAVTLSMLFGVKLMLENQKATLEATIQQQVDALKNNYPTWKVLENDPDYLGRFLGRSDDDYLVNVFTNLSPLDFPRFRGCLTKAYGVQQRNLSRLVKSALDNEYARFTQYMVREMMGLVGGPINNPVRSFITASPYSVTPP